MVNENIDFWDNHFLPLPELSKLQPGDFCSADIKCSLCVFFAKIYNDFWVVAMGSSLKPHIKIVP